MEDTVEMILQSSLMACCGDVTSDTWDIVLEENLKKDGKVGEGGNRKEKEYRY